MHLTFSSGIFLDFSYLGRRIRICSPLLNLTFEHIEIYQFLWVFKFLDPIYKTLFRFDIMRIYCSVDFKSFPLLHQLILDNLLYCLNFVIWYPLHRAIKNWQILCSSPNSLYLGSNSVNIVDIFQYLNLTLPLFRLSSPLRIPKLLERQYFASIAQDFLHLFGSFTWVLFSSTLGRGRSPTFLSLGSHKGWWLLLAWSWAIDLTELLEFLDQVKWILDVLNWGSCISTIINVYIDIIVYAILKWIVLFYFYDLLIYVLIIVYIVSRSIISWGGLKLCLITCPSIWGKINHLSLLLKLMICKYLSNPSHPLPLNTFLHVWGWIPETSIHYGLCRFSVYR